MLQFLLFPPREDGSDPRSCPQCHDGRLSIKFGKYGAFLGCSHYPECSYTKPLTDTKEEEQKDASRLEMVKKEIVSANKVYVPVRYCDFNYNYLNKQLILLF